MDRRKTKDVLWFVFQCAKDDRLAYADAVEEGTEEYKKAMADVKAFETLQSRLFGTSESKFDTEVKKMKSFSIFDVRKILKDSPEIFVHMDGCECDYCRNR